MTSSDPSSNVPGTGPRPELDEIDDLDSPRRRYGFRHLGRPSGRILEHDRRLAAILTTYFFVEGLWIPVYRPREGKRASIPS